MPDQDERARLRELANGFRVAQCLHTALELGIFEQLRRGPQTGDALARLAGADPDALTRLLRALVLTGLVQTGDDGAFAITPMGQLLCEGVTGSLRAEVRNLLHPSSWAAWGQLQATVETGEAAFPKVFGQRAWAYRAAHPEAGRVFDAMAQQCAARDSETILRHLDLTGVPCMVDVGGGNGALLAALLAAHPGLRGILFDQPAVVAGAGPVLGAAGATDRCQVVGGDFFADLPRGGDLYVLKAILHDWDDAAAVRLLINLRRAMSDDARLVIIESLLDGEPTAAQAFMDLHMLVIHGGRERNEAEYAALLRAAGFRLTGVTRTDGGPALLYGTPE